MTTSRFSTRSQVAAVTAVAVLAFAGGAAAKGGYDAQNAKRLDGYTHDKMSSISVAPQGVHASGAGVTSSADGVYYSPTATGEMRFGFVVPRDHKPGTPLKVVLVYREDSAGACSWVVETSGLEGPDSDTGPDIHNGGWRVPGSTGYSGPITVPAGEGSVHTATFKWPFLDNPGMFIQFALQRLGNDPGDTCSTIGIYGIEVRY